MKLQGFPLDRANWQWQTGTRETTTGAVPLLVEGISGPIAGTAGMGLAADLWTDGPKTVIAGSRQYLEYTGVYRRPWFKTERFTFFVPPTVAAPSGDIAGTTTLLLDGSASLLGSGALVGAAALTFAGSDTLLGSGALLGSSTVTFDATDTLTATGVLAGASALQLDATGTLLGSGALAGSAAAVFGATASADQGAMQGATALVFDASAALLGAAAAVGSADLVLAASGVLTGTGDLVGSSAAVFSLAGDLTGAAAGDAVGSSDLLFTLAGDLVTLTPADQPAQTEVTGGGWRFWLRYEQEQLRRERARRKRLEDEEEAQQLADATEREIARLLHEQERRDAERRDLERLRALVTRYRGRIETDSERVKAALAAVEAKASRAALERLDREIRRAQDEEEEFLIHAAFMLLDD